MSDVIATHVPRCNAKCDGDLHYFGYIHPAVNSRYRMLARHRQRRVLWFWMLQPWMGD